MGSKHSKGAVRRELRPIIPREWSDLEQLYARYQLEVYRQQLHDANLAYFMPRPLFVHLLSQLCGDKATLLAIFHILDHQDQQRIAAIDFFSGLVLVMQAKKTAKFEFLLGLLDNGGLKELNLCEVTMVLMAAARGVAMFKTLPQIRHELLRHLAKRLIGDHKDIPRQAVVEKAMADPEIVFFMNDLEPQTATTADGLLMQQAQLTRSFAAVDYRIARIEALAKRPPSAEYFYPAPLTAPSKMENRLASVEILHRKLQNVLSPPQAAKAASNAPGGGSTGDLITLSTDPVDIRRHISYRSLQRMIHRISDGVLTMTLCEAESLMRQMSVNQLGQARVGDIVRVMKNWLWESRQEQVMYWEEIANVFEKQASRLRASFDSLRKSLKSCRKSREKHPVNPIDDSRFAKESDINYTAKLRIAQTSKPENQNSTYDSKNLRFRLGLYSAKYDEELQDSKSENNQQSRPIHTPKDEPVIEHVTADTSVGVLFEFAIWDTMTDEEGMDMAHAIESFITDARIWCFFDFICSECTVSIAESARTGHLSSLPGLAPSRFLHIYLRFHVDILEDIEANLGVVPSDLIHHAYFIGELESSASVIYQRSIDLVRTLHSMSRLENRDQILAYVFDRFNVSKTGQLGLEEFNTLQQALHRAALDESEFGQIFNNAQELSFEEFLACFEGCGSEELATTLSLLGIGSLNDLIRGILSFEVVFHEPSLAPLQSLLSKLRWKERVQKLLLWISRNTADCGVDLSFPNLAACLSYLQFEPASVIGALTSPKLLTATMTFFREFLTPRHKEHPRGRQCRSMLCSLEEETSKTAQQLDFEDQSRSFVSGTSAARIDLLQKCLVMLTLSQKWIAGLEFVEVRGKNMRAVLEIDNLHFPLTPV